MEVERFVMPPQVDRPGRVRAPRHRRVVLQDVIGAVHVHRQTPLGLVGDFQRLCRLPSCPAYGDDLSSLACVEVAAPSPVFVGRFYERGQIAKRGAGADVRAVAEQEAAAGSQAFEGAHAGLLDLVP